MNRRSTFPKLAASIAALMLLTLMALAPQKAAAQCICNQYRIIVDSDVPCSVTLCVPVNGGETCSTYAPGTDSIVANTCGLPNSATLVTGCGRVAPPAPGTCKIIQPANGCCVEVCSIATGVGCTVLHFRRVNNPVCPCP
jgi:hypothetical protein